MFQPLPAAKTQHRNDRGGPERFGIPLLVEEAAEQGHGECDQETPGAGAGARDEAGMVGAVDMSGIGDGEDDESGGYEHGEEHRGEDALDARDGGDGAEDDAEGAAGGQP